MSKKELEFIDCEAAFAWQPVPGEAQGVVEKILSRDPETGDYTRLLRFPAGFAGAEVLTHSFWEEVYILDGWLLDIRTGQIFSKGYYACRPPGMVHGPYRAPEGCMTFETRYTADDTLLPKVRTKSGGQPGKTTRPHKMSRV